MNQTISARLVLISLAMIVGCGQSATNAPKKLESLVVEEPAEPVSTAERVSPAEPIDHSLPGELLPPAQGGPVEQAAFAEESKLEGVEPATVPPVLLSNQHAVLCRVKVGDALPEIALPNVAGGESKIAALYGKAATVVVFWKGDRQMALDELADLGPDVVEKFGSRGVEVVGIAVNQPAADVQTTIQKTAANFPHLLDADGKAFDKMGAQTFPWTFVLDSNGKIVWFDLEYSLATRRELRQALLATVR